MRLCPVQGHDPEHVGLVAGSLKASFLRSVFHAVGSMETP